MSNGVPLLTWQSAWEGAKRWLFPLLLLMLIAGGLLRIAGLAQHGSLVWLVATGIGFVLLSLDIAINIARGHFALDLIAAIAMGAALSLGQGLAGIIVAIMYSGGQALEDFARGRVNREMNALLAAAPRTAARYVQEQIEEVSVEAIGAGDRILVRRGEVVPVDGVLLSPSAMLDESTLTGEALPVHRTLSAEILSGATNAGDAFELQATSTSADSTFSGIVRLIQAAQMSKAPIMRIADRYAVTFLVVTLAVAGGAWWLSSDPLRALAVLVVATPCPLILAVPVAILSGVSRCARNGVLVKGGEALERLAQIDTVLMDKTGTITDGRARLVETRTFGDFDPQQILSLAASLDQGSPHVLAQALVAAAQAKALRLESPTDMREVPGSGIEGMVGGRHVAIGGLGYVMDRCEPSPHAAQIRTWIANKATIAVVVAVDGHLAGVLLFADRVRPEAPTVLRQLRSAGVDRIVLLTGDQASLAADVAAFLGMDDCVSEMKPQDKAAAVATEKANGRAGVMMIGDGVNDAPALAAADVGVAMGARGAAASSEAADVVILVDRLDRLVTALRIARRARQIALQSAFVGMGLSAVAMGFAAFGYLPAIGGALLQEAIDVLVIVNALRALGGPIWRLRSPRQMTSEKLQGLEDEHRQLMPLIDDIRALADTVAHLPDDQLREKLGQLSTALRERLLPHERNDERVVFAKLHRPTDDLDMYSGMTRTHMEIQRQIHTLESLSETVSRDGPGDAIRRDIQRLLDGLDAITRLHFEQEEEVYRLLESR